MRVRLKLDGLHELIARSNLSQNHWAMKLGLSRGHWSDIVNGKHPYPSAKTRERMVEVFGVEVQDLFEAETGQPVVFTFGSSGNLARQIENGAPVDVSAAANVASVDDLQLKGLIVAGSQQLYAQGRVVLAVNRDSGVQAEWLEDLLQPAVTHVALANPDHAPYGLAAKQALQSVGLWEALQPKLVYGENVRQAMQFVQTGNADAGLVALSVADMPELSYTLVDPGLYQPLHQVIAVVQGTSHEAVAHRFIAFVNGPQGQAILRRYGFLPPP